MDAAAAADSDRAQLAAGHQLVDLRSTYPQALGDFGDLQQHGSTLPPSTGCEIHKRNDVADVDIRGAPQSWADMSRAGISFARVSPPGSPHRSPGRAELGDALTAPELGPRLKPALRTDRSAPPGLRVRTLVANPTNGKTAAALCLVVTVSTHQGEMRVSEPSGVPREPLTRLLG